jgi:glutamate synthase domain-containing protein 2
MDLLLGVGLVLAAGVGGVFVRDRFVQREHAILRNYPVVGHFRYAFEDLGAYFRQYWFTADWEERPFDRITRAWVYRSAKGVSNYVAFGSEADLQERGQVLFLHSAFPVNEDEIQPYRPRTIGEGSCANPYRPLSFFNISGMSYGALSAPAVKSLSAGAAEAGIWMATGEGGLSPHHLSGGCDVVFQIGTAKYGVRDADGNLDEAKLAAVASHAQVRMIEIKLSQGAKPGKGGILPGAKVTPEIAAIRGIPAGRPSISPNRHREVTDVESLLALINRVRRVAGKPVGIKFCVGDPAFLDDLFATCAARPAEAPDFVTVDGGEGGTGAAPAPLAEHVGLSIRQALPLVAERRAFHGLDERIRIIASGKLVTPELVAWALCTGADYVVSARGFMLALGCIQSLKCDTGRCPTGVTTPDPRFTRGLDPSVKAVRVAAYARAVIHDVAMIAHSCGCREPGELAPPHVRVVDVGAGRAQAQG